MRHCRPNSPRRGTERRALPDGVRLSGRRERAAIPRAVSAPREMAVRSCPEAYGPPKPGPSQCKQGYVPDSWALSARSLPEKVGSAAPPWRWVAERSFVWLGRNRRLARDFGTTMGLRYGAPLRPLRHAAPNAPTPHMGSQ